MDFVHIWHDGRIFIKKSQGQSFCVKVYKTSYFEDPFSFIYGMMVDIGLKFLLAPSPPLGVKDLEFSWKKSKFFVFKFI